MHGLKAISLSTCFLTENTLHKITVQESNGCLDSLHSLKNTCKLNMPKGFL